MKSNLRRMLYLSIVLLGFTMLFLSCTHEPIVPPSPNDVKFSPNNLHKQLVSGSKVISIHPIRERSEYCSTLAGCSDVARDHLLIMHWNSQAGSAISRAYFDFDLSAIPKGSFIASAKVYLFLLRVIPGVSGLSRYEASYDESLGYLLFREVNKPQNVYRLDKLDFSGGWYCADFTKIIAEKVARNEKHFEFLLAMEPQGVVPNSARQSIFASSRMGSHATPTLLVESVLK